MVEGARSEVARIRAEVEDERARVLAGAAEEGRRQGWARAGAILAAAAAERDRSLVATEREVVSLAVAVARKVIGRELEEPSRTAVVELAAHAIKEARERRHVILRVSPTDSAAARAAEGRLGALLARGALSVREDSSLSPGDVVVETESGRIDARVETQLAALARDLEEAFP
jgi:flagellar biosynthesis/type III secretory pathway protein FliH